MVLGSKLTKCIIQDSLGAKIGKVTGVIVDTREKDWQIIEILVKEGLLKATRTVPVTLIKKFHESEEKIELTKAIELNNFDKAKITQAYMPMEEIKDRKIVSKDNETIGTIYDYVIATNLSPWQVTKLLIRPSEERLKGRRIRLDVEQVISIKDMITVNYSKEEAENKAIE